MEYRRLGRTRVRVSPLCLGSMNFGGRADGTESFEIIDRALAAGITSPIIGPRTPEQLAGSLLAMEITLGADEPARLDRVAPPGRATVPYYGHDGMAWVPQGPHEYRW